jgi:hypothetical protein
LDIISSHGYFFLSIGFIDVCRNVDISNSQWVYIPLNYELSLLKIKVHACRTMVITALHITDAGVCTTKHFMDVIYKFL